MSLHVRSFLLLFSDSKRSFFENGRLIIFGSLSLVCRDVAECICKLEAQRANQASDKDPIALRGLGAKQRHRDVA